MIIRWGGAGILALVILFFGAFGGTMVASWFDQSDSVQNLGTSIGFVVGGVAVWFSGRGLNGPRLNYDRWTQQWELIQENRHRLMGIPMQYWAIVGPVMAIVMFNNALHS